MFGKQIRPCNFIYICVCVWNYCLLGHDTDSTLDMSLNGTAVNCGHHWSKFDISRLTKKTNVTSLIECHSLWSSEIWFSGMAQPKMPKPSYIIFFEFSLFFFYFTIQKIFGGEKKEKKTKCKKWKQKRKWFWVKQIASLFDGVGCDSSESNGSITYMP